MTIDRQPPLTPSRAAAEQIGGAALDQHLEYKREVHAGDLITVRSNVGEARKKSIRFFHEMTNDETGEVAATTIVIGGCIDLNMRRPHPSPADVRESAGLMAEEGLSDTVPALNR